MATKSDNRKFHPNAHFYNDEDSEFEDDKFYREQSDYDDAQAQTLDSSPADENLIETHSISDDEEDDSPTIEGKKVKACLEEEKKRGLVLGNSYYLVALGWWRRWCNYVNYYYDSGVVHPHPGKINNSVLLENGESDIVRKDCQERFDFVYVPEDVWSFLHEKYQGGPALKRQCRKLGYYKELAIEVRLLSFSVIYSKDVSHPRTVSFSKATTLREFILAMRKELRFKLDRVRVFDFHRGSRFPMDKMGKTLSEYNIMEGQYVLIEVRRKNGQWPKESKYKEYMGGYYSRLAPTEPGKTGLVNLGNTCFMNSSLQCLSATVPIADFLLSGAFRSDINTQNPLGSKGELAEAYAAVVEELWSASTAVCDPRDFKFVLSKSAPQFTGYQQHDSHELLAFLLDGLHEDLNRIIKKPYVQLRDAEGRADEEVAAEAWAAHLARNNSVVVDYFQGLFKSTLTCPVANHTAIKFDPLMYLSVPLPVETTQKFVVTFHAMDPLKRPRRFLLTLSKSGSILDMKSALSKLVSVAPKHLAVMELHGSKVYTELTNREDLGALRGATNIHCYEVSSSLSRVSPSSLEAAGEAAGSDVDHDGASSDDDDGAGYHLQPYRTNFVYRPYGADARSPDVVRVTLYHKKDYGATFHTFFGDPMVLSVRPDISHSEFVDTILTRMHLLMKTPFVRPGDEFEDGNGGEFEDVNGDAFEGENGDAFEEGNGDVFEDVNDAAAEESDAPTALSDATGNDAAATLSAGDNESHTAGGNESHTAGFVSSWDQKDREDNASDADGSSDSDEDSFAAFNTTTNFVASAIYQPKVTTGFDFGKHSETHNFKFGSQNSDWNRYGTAAAASSRVPFHELTDADYEAAPFIICPSSTFGQDTGRALNPAAESLNLRDKETFLLLWERENKEYYYDEDAEAYDDDDSMSEYNAAPSAGGDRAKKSLSLGDCLNLFNQAEQLGEKDQWYCPECKEHRQAMKQMDIWIAPKILVVHLKRFAYQSQTRRERLDHFVDFPLEALDMAQYIKGPKTETTLYDLYAVSNHYGSLSGGHYTAYARHRNDGQWYLYDDSSCSPASESDIVSSAAYMLFYRRRDVPWPQYTPQAQVESESESESESDDDDDDDSELEELLPSESTSLNSSGFSAWSRETDSDDDFMVVDPRDNNSAYYKYQDQQHQSFGFNTDDEDDDDNTDRTPVSKEEIELAAREYDSISLSFK